MNSHNSNQSSNGLHRLRSQNGRLAAALLSASFFMPNLAIAGTEHHTRQPMAEKILEHMTRPADNGLIDRYAQINEMEYDLMVHPSQVMKLNGVNSLSKEREAKLKRFLAGKLSEDKIFAIVNHGDDNGSLAKYIHPLLNRDARMLLLHDCDNDEMVYVLIRDFPFWYNIFLDGNISKNIAAAIDFIERGESDSATYNFVTDMIPELLPEMVDTFEADRIQRLRLIPNINILGMVESGGFAMELVIRKATPDEIRAMLGPDAPLVDTSTSTTPASAIPMSTTSISTGTPKLIENKK